MAGEKNPFDETVWDPTNPEQAIEDPMHGPSATFDLLQIPAMPYGNGIYHQFGGYYAFSTTRVNANGQPLLIINLGKNYAEIEREIDMQSEWIRTFHQDGDAGLARIEAERQQQRLEKKGYTLAFKDTDVCGGGERLGDCDTATEMRTSAQEYANKQYTKRPGEGQITHELSWLSRKCGACALNCSIGIQTNNGSPNGITRFTNTQSVEKRIMNIKFI
jgi:hypothetical protein